MILIALACSSAISFSWIILMRFLTGIMVWTSVILLIVGSGGGLGYSVFRQANIQLGFIVSSEKYSAIGKIFQLISIAIYRYLQVKDQVDGPTNIFEVNYTPQFLHDILKLRDTWLAFTIILSIIFIIVLCLFIALRQRINLAIKMIEHGSKAVSSMCSSLFIPIIPFILHAAVIVWFLAIGCYMASISKKEYNIYYDQDQTGNPSL